MLSPRFVVSVFLAVLLAHQVAGQEFVAPIVQFQALNSKGFRLALPASEGLKNFEFHGVLKSGKDGTELRKFDVHPELSDDSNWLVYEDNTVQVSVGDVISFWVFFSHNALGYRYDDQTHEITKLVPPNTKFRIEGSLATSCITTPTRVSTGKACKGQILFEDHFRATTLDTKRWRVEKRLVDSKRENGFMSIQPNTVTVEGGNLKITPKLQKDIDDTPLKTGVLNITDGCTGPSINYCKIDESSNQVVPEVVTGKVTTRTSFNFKYGKIVVRAKLPQGDWIYPEITLESSDVQYGETGYSSGVIRIAFARGNMQLTVNGVKYDNSVVSGGVLLNQMEPCRSDGNIAKEFTNAPLGNEFNDYAVIWQEDSIRLLVDDREYGSISAPPGGFRRYDAKCKQIPWALWKSGSAFAPFDQKFFISLGVGVAGVSDFPDIDGKPWRNLESKAKLKFYASMDTWYPTWGANSALIVDYVKVWAL